VRARARSSFYWRLVLVCSKDPLFVLLQRHPTNPLTSRNPFTLCPVQPNNSLADRADVLIENFRPGVMEGWGLGPRDLKPDLVYARISGYGQTGARRVCVFVSWQAGGEGREEA
jgi:hypothetical protein